MQRFIGLFTTDDDDKCEKLCKTVGRAIADVYREFQNISFEFTQHFKKKYNTVPDHNTIRLPTEAARIVSRGKNE